jgi:hypothetical protein
MKNRKLLYLLVPMTLVLWGLIVFRIYRHFNQEPELAQVFSNAGSLSSAKQAEDSFALTADYSDPFLERRLSSSAGYISEPKTTKKSNPKSIIRSTIQWPPVKYGGMITNKNNKSVLYLVQIDNTNHLMKKGEEVAHIKLAKVFKDSIIIELKKNYKTIIKEKI